MAFDSVMCKTMVKSNKDLGLSLRKILAKDLFKRSKLEKIW